MSYPQVQIGKVASVRSGYAFSSRDWKDNGVPVVKIANIKDGLIKLDGCSYVSSETATRNPSAQLHNGDILITMTGHIGEVARVRMSNHLLLNQRVGKFTILDNEALDPDFFFYTLRQDSLMREMRSHAYGVAQPNISPALIEGLTIPLPPVEVQTRIADILSAYDDLIKNNTRRIAILDEMARNLYREWFVEFRFPGHEQVPLVESEFGPIPAGWSLKRLGDLVELVYGKALPATSRVAGPVLVYGSSGIVGFHNVALVQGPGIIVGRKGNVGTVFWSHDDFFPIDTVYYVRTSLPLHYMYFHLVLDQEFLSGDAAVPGLNRSLAYLNPVVLPSLDLITKFAKIVSVLTEQCRVLSHTVSNLTETRDLLLPKLISGEIDMDVENEGTSGT